MVLKTTKRTNMLGSRPTIIILMKEECKIESGLIINSTSCNNYHCHLFPLTLVSDENNQNFRLSSNALKPLSVPLSGLKQ